MQHGEVLSVRDPDLDELSGGRAFVDRLIRPVVYSQVREEILREAGAESGDVVADAAVGDGGDGGR